jgi:hypothetical protein
MDYTIPFAIPQAEPPPESPFFEVPGAVAVIDDPIEALLLPIEARQAVSRKSLCLDRAAEFLKRCPTEEDCALGIRIAESTRIVKQNNHTLDGALVE